MAIIVDNVSRFVLVVGITYYWRDVGWRRTFRMAQPR